LRAQGRWRLILNVVDHLPAYSAYGDAVAQDDDLAAELAAEPPRERGAPGGPAVGEWSPTVAALTELVDVVALIRTEMWSLAGQKRPPRYSPSPRPAGAAERVAARALQRSADDVVTQLFGERS
jgi:hypothetical protein